MRKIILTALILGSLAGVSTASAASTTTKVITPDDMATSIADVLAEPTSWFFYNDEDDTIDDALGSFVPGPGTPPAGSDSVEISVSGTERRNLATYQFSGTPLEDITELGYSTYNPSAGNGGSANRSAYLQFNVDFDGSDSWQRRLLFLPADNGDIEQDEWQDWDALDEGDALWRYSGPTWPGTVISGSTARTWDDILTSYEGVRIRVSDSWLGMRVGEPYANGYTENIDRVVFGTADGTTIFDFEIEPPAVTPITIRDCMQGGWQELTRADGSDFKNQGHCIKYVNTGR